MVFNSGKKRKGHLKEFRKFQLYTCTPSTFQWGDMSMEMLKEHVYHFSSISPLDTCALQCSAKATVLSMHPATEADLQLSQSEGPSSEGWARPLPSQDPSDLQQHTVHVVLE